MQISGPQVEAHCGCLPSAAGWAVGAASGPEMRAHRPSQQTLADVSWGEMGPEYGSQNVPTGWGAGLLRM